MATSIFKIYDGRTNFWQWDTHQKLIVFDESITHVQFSNRNMTHSITRDVYVDSDNIRIVNIPDDLLKLPLNLVAYACAGDTTVKSVKFAVLKRPIPEGYVANVPEDLDEKLEKIDVRLHSLDENKADNIYYDENDQSIQLLANGELIGDKVELSSVGAYTITDCTINEDGHLIVTFSDGRTIDAGYVGSANGVVFTPHISEDLILSWTNNGDLENPDPVDLNPHDEWTTLPEEGVQSEYEWEFI